MKVKRYWFVAAMGLVLLAVLVTLSACDPLSLLQDPPAPPTPPAEQPILAVHQPYRMVEVWLAATQTYPRSEFSLAKQKIAQAIDDAVQVNSDGMVITIGLLGSNSFDPSATKMTITIPKIAADPVEPTLKPTPTALSDPYAYGNAVATVEAQNGEISDQYQQKLRRNHAYLTQVRQQIRIQTNELRSLDPPVDTSTDFWGAIGRSARRFQGVQAKKQLILAMGFEGISWQQFTSDIYIRGVAVSVIYHYCSNQPRCEATTSFWQGVFMHAGASSANFYDDVQSQGLSLFSSDTTEGL